jgi:hypothetical protein
MRSGSQQSLVLHTRQSNATHVFTCGRHSTGSAASASTRLTTSIATAAERAATARGYASECATAAEHTAAHRGAAALLCGARSVDNSVLQRGQLLTRPTDTWRLVHIYSKQNSDHDLLLSRSVGPCGVFARRSNTLVPR